MNRRGVLQATQLSAAHALLLAFTVLLVLKLDHVFSGSWWRVFSPLWLFHAVLARWRFSLPAPSDVHYCHRPPSHAFAATQLLVAFEVLLCIYLETSAVNLKIVFLPVVLLEIIIIVDNVRYVIKPKSHNLLYLGVNLFLFFCELHKNVLFTNDRRNGRLECKFCIGENYCDAAIGNWWGAYFVFRAVWFIFYSVGQCLAFLVSTKWTYPVIHRCSQTRVCSLSSGTTDNVNQPGCLVAKVEEDQKPDRMCSLQYIGGHCMKVLMIAFQVLLCMHLQGTPPRAREIPFQIIFSPLLLLQGAGALCSTLQLFERIGIMLLHIEADSGRYFMFSSRVYDFLEFMLHGSRFLGWWSTDEGRGEEERVHHNHGSGCYTFSINPPDVLKTISKRDLLEEVWMLQVALDEQIKAVRSNKRKYELLRKKMLLCKICSDVEIDTVLLPCGHWILCRFCFNNYTSCPFCQVSIQYGLLVYNA